MRNGLIKGMLFAIPLSLLLWVLGFALVDVMSDVIF